MTVGVAPVRVADDALVAAPQSSVDTRFFWQSGADGYLRIQRCAECGRYAHPPAPHCRNCGAPGPTPTIVSGHATVFSYTINRHTFVPWQAAPYALAIVALDEQSDVHLTTRLVDIAFEDIVIGLPVSVVFERHGEVYLPLFGPHRGAAARQVDAI
ncbi:Zn-ribbon domain-containing OB-fold protein [Mycobacterium avium]|uniref:Zn-ribbon domain-containing OB-fold protein n=1 Tax=Mycobacterium avium TaxID=1764 RepID=UPI001CC529C6|nr:OB-fold domain-containing protein [Mycobacterium avium]